MRPLLLAAPLPLGPRALARLAPAVERPGNPPRRVARARRARRVGHDARDSQLLLRGRGPGAGPARRQAPHPRGLGQVPQRGGVRGRAGQDPEPGGRGRRSDYPALLAVAPRARESASDDHDDVLLRLAVSMRAHRRGGALLVVPAGTEAWRESIVHPIPYAVAPAFTELGDLVREKARDGQWHGAHRPRRGRGRGPDRGGRRDADHGPLRAARLRREDRAARTAARASSGWSSPSRSRAAPRPWWPRCSSAARGTSRRRSSPRTSRTPWRSSRRRTATSRSSRGRRAGMVHAHRVETLLL